jgi:hypothetical protein
MRQSKREEFQIIGRKSSFVLLSTSVLMPPNLRAHAPFAFCRVERTEFGNEIFLTGFAWQANQCIFMAILFLFLSIIQMLAAKTTSTKRSLASITIKHTLRPFGASFLLAAFANQ